MPFVSTCKLAITIVVSATLLVAGAIALILFLLCVRMVELTRRKWNDTFGHE